MNKKASVNIVKVINETPKAMQVIYIHFEDPSQFAIVWIPKSQAEFDGTVMEIPVWLKNKIASTAKRYTAKKFINEFNITDYAYGFNNTGFFDNAGNNVTEKAHKFSTFTRETTRSYS